jgi:hypothetical protein
MERLLFVTLLGAAAVAIADGPGTQILTTPQVPTPGNSRAADNDRQRCEAMSGAHRDRCLRTLRNATGRPGPEANGPGSNAGTGATSGSSGASSAVGGAR